MNITEWKMHIDQLKLSDGDFENPRTHSGLANDEIRETALSIVKHGLLVPLIVRQDGLVLAGKRRFHALGLVVDWLNSEGDDVPEIDPERRSELAYFLTQIPVRVVSLVMGDKIDYQALALIDNLFRSDLSSYEIAASLAKLSEAGKTGVAISKMIGKSESYVSRKLSAWKKSGPELKAAWQDGMTEEAVEEFAKLPFAQQAKALAGPIPRGRRGPAHRPSVEAVRDFLFELEQQPRPAGAHLAVGREARDFAYRAGVIDALRWATGARVGPEFVRLAEPEPEKPVGFAAGTHSESCAKAHDHAKRCTCHLAGNYPPEVG